MSASLKDGLVEAWVEDLAVRLPDNHAIYPHRRPKKRRPGDHDIAPPFTVLSVGEMEQTVPASGAWLAEVRVVVVCDKDHGGSAEQKRRVAEIIEALEETCYPAVDEERGVRLFGYALERIRQAEARHVFSDVLFLVAGVGDLASSAGSPLLS